ncbi:MAG: tungstate transporter permease, partial [Anaerolineae bacterium]|nr:tungstate transporter permease [Anaerolineae bacterium]
MQTFIDALQEAVRLLFELDPLVMEIALRSLQVTLGALVISTLLGIPLGALIALAQFPGKRLVVAIVYTGMGLPPVVVGLVVYLFLSRSGAWATWAWLLHR